MSTYKLAVAAALLCSLSLHAQETKPNTKAKTPNTHPWVAKWNPGSLVFGKIGLAGEYSLRPKRSVTLNVGIPSERTFTRDNAEERIGLAVKTFSLQGGYRMYLGRKPMTGFYFEPYLKYVNFQANGSFDNKDLTDREIYNVGLNYKGFGVGAQLGVQFMIAKRVTFDFFLLGPEANSARFTGTFRDITSPIPWTLIEEEDARREITDFLKDVPILGNKTEIEVNRNNRTVGASYRGFLPGFRLGGSIGFRF